ncbi:hypothetical protein [Mastigocoleus testarum]|uniref:Uncharacterized protein n=1 Tax=Mastigocoleus testarum BC008 TaxID=371196 RepID=A0A0V7ZXA8_9CYAN|nr:hypothetical protein [Mastigocoleus testarum]KST69010.1 hypothetical protein BC008_02790 [Mastigocoleus testarum BC008]
MSTELKLDDLKKIRQELTKLINIIRAEVSDAFDMGEISTQQWLRARDKWGDLETIELELQGYIDYIELDFILNTNVDSPYSRILQATNSLKNSARNIDNFNNFLSDVTEVLNIFTSTVRAFQTGGIIDLQEI